MWLIIGSYKKIGLSHEMGLINTAPFDFYAQIKVLFTLTSQQAPFSSSF